MDNNQQENHDQPQENPIEQVNLNEEQVEDQEWASEDESEEQEIKYKGVEDEEQKLDPSWKKKDEIKHCQHYLRWCEKQAPCCKVFYPCRLCHDDKYRGPKGPGCTQEIMKRQEVTLIRCKRCGLEQASKKSCQNCNICFGVYYCDICKFWDDDSSKNIYHCEKCNMCRRGIKEEMYHCDNCDICLSLTIKEKHQCTQKAFQQNCPICQGNLKESVKGVQQMPLCSHWIHAKCLTDYIKQSQTNRCPVCNTAIQKMSKEDIEIYDQLAQQTSDQLPQELKDRKINIQCHECHKETKDIPFHFYLKCQHCGSYNTKE